MSGTNPDLHESELADIRDEVTEPPMYRVMIHNDDYTTKEFVVEVLMAVFSKSVDEATGIMWSRPPKWDGAVRRLPLRGGRNQGPGGDGGRTGKRLPAAS